MAAYAAIVSLLRTLDLIQDPNSTVLVRYDQNQIQSLRQVASCLQFFLESNSQRRRKELEDALEAQILDAAYAAEDIIESRLVDQILGGTASCRGDALQKVIEKMAFIEEEMRGGMMAEQQSTKSVATAGSATTVGTSTMVGFEEDMIQLMDGLTGQQSNLQVMPIVGMGGIGKTTLARNVYNNPYIVKYFHLRAWVTVSQEYSVREILLAILHGIGVPGDSRKQEGDENLMVFMETNREKSDEQLGEQLYKKLSGQRYLIVMDDIWSTGSWDEVKKFLPNNKNRSRVMVTTRLSDVALHFGSCRPHKLNFLDEGKCWILFCNVVFPREGCPPNLKDIGETLVKKCRGLPLAIVAIGGLLAKSDMTRESWEYIAQDVNSLANSGDDEHCLKILSLSYNHLPVHLKPCFLYIAMFPEDYEIRVSRLMKLWVAEGFLKPVRAKTLEEVAEMYLKDLVDRNLILVSKRGSCGKIKSCTIHDLLRDLCLREARKEEFVCVSKENSLQNPPSVGRRISLLPSTRSQSLWEVVKILPPTSPSSLRSLVCDFRVRFPNLTSNLRLLRIIDAIDARFKKVPRLANLRYVATPTTKWLLRDASLSLFRNLQILVVNEVFIKNPIHLPSEFWNMYHLRHLEIKHTVLPNLSVSQMNDSDPIVLSNLQTLSTVRNFVCTEEVVAKIPNLKKARIIYMDVPEGIKWSYYSVNNLVRFHKLESLTCSVRDKIVPGNFKFPSSLRKLTMDGCRLPWKNMTMIGCLPNLVVLKLKFYAFEGPEWSPNEGEFLQLKCLEIGKTNLLHWRAEKNHFPRLERLVLGHTKLAELPSGIGEIDSLRLIQVDLCSDSFWLSVKQILEEQESLGNTDLHVKVL